MSFSEKIGFLAGFKGLKPQTVFNDLVAGFVIAALSIPIAMGYASIVGLPPMYGLYASMIAPLVFAFVTKTRNIVFGMDSAVSAMTGSMLAFAGVALGTQQTIDFMPLLTIFTAVFVILFAVCRAGKIIRLIPIPVVHGFVCGISVSVILGQIPLLTATAPGAYSGFIGKVVAIFSALPQANAAATIMSVVSLAALFAFKKWLPKVPGELVVLIGAALATAVFDLGSLGVVTLEAPESGFCMPVIPSLVGVNWFELILCAFAIALVVALESLLCVETFSLKEGVRAEGNRELFSFGLTNVVVGFFGCPPCSASISRTAAGLSAGGKSQLASVFAALVICVVCLLCAPLLVFLPRAALSAIVVVALIGVCDFKKIARYATKVPYEFVVFLLSALVVLVWGAIPGIAAGFVFSVLLLVVRKRALSNEQMLGAVASADYDVPEKGEPLDYDFNLVKFKMQGSLSFLNIDAQVDRLLNLVKDDTQAVVIKMSKVESIDTTATDKLLQLLDLLHARGIHVKIVRKMRPTKDHYTRFELRYIMTKALFYPNVRTALASIQREMAQGVDPRRPETRVMERAAGEDGSAYSEAWQQLGILPGDRPVVSILENSPEKRLMKGKLSFMQSQQALEFQCVVGKPGGDKPYVWLAVSLMDSDKAADVLGLYLNGVWSGKVTMADMDNCLSAITVCVCNAYSDEFLPPAEDAGEAVPA